jgi:hypothetical protein
LDLPEHDGGGGHRDAVRDASGQVPGAEILAVESYVVLFPGRQRRFSDFSPDVFHLEGGPDSHRVHARYGAPHGGVLPTGRGDLLQRGAGEVEARDVRRVGTQSQHISRVGGLRRVHSLQGEFIFGYFWLFLVIFGFFGNYRMGN